MEVGSVEVGPAEAGPAEVGIAEVGPAEVGPAEVGPAEAFYFQEHRPCCLVEYFHLMELSTIPVRLASRRLLSCLMYVVDSLVIVLNGPLGQI